MSEAWFAAERESGVMSEFDAYLSLAEVSDDQRWDTFDATHHSPNRPGPVMPILKSELIGSGVTFTHGYMTTALCCPSRTSILTGST